MTDSPQFSLVAADGQLHVAGTLDFAVAAGMAPVLSKCIAELPESFSVELSALNDFNSAVLVFLLDCVRLAALADKQCRFSGVSTELMNMLKMASLADLVADVPPS